jgi:hypothetical protein
MPAAARLNVAACAAALLALGAACGSSLNGPTGVYADGGAALGGGDAHDGDTAADRAAAETGGVETGSEAGSGVGLQCPSSFTGRADGTPCFSVLTACDYPEGRCGCLVCELGPQSFGFAWSCRRWDSGGVGCPARSPASSSPCDVEGLVCRYAAYCSVSVGDDLQCQGGTWQPAPPLDKCGYRSCPN